MGRYQIWDHWTKLGEVNAASPDHAIRVFHREHGYAWVRLFVYPAA